MGERKEYYTKSDFKNNTGYTREEAERKYENVRETLMTGKRTAYKKLEIEPDPRGGYRVVATYKAGIHHYDREGNIKYTTPTDDYRSY